MFLRQIYFLFGHTVTQKHFVQYSINQLAYDVNLMAPNNQLNFKSLLGYIWYIYSNLSVDVVGNDFYYDLRSCLCGRDRFDEVKI